METTNTDTINFTAPSSNKNKIYSFKLLVSDGNYEVERMVTVAVRGQKSSNGTYYYHNDHLGTPQVMTDAESNVVWKASYLPFGQSELVVNEIENNLRFPGQYYDEETGLHYNYFRDYDPELGRYIQSDPIGLAGGINTYAYVSGNPIKYYDPLGLLKWTGSVSSFSASAIVGGSISFYELTSECVDGRKATINVTAVGPALGVGATFGGSWSDISFDDRNPNDLIDPSRFNGSYVSTTATAGFVAGGVTMGPHKLGKAVTTKDSLFGMPKLAYDASAAIVFGSSTVMDTSYSNCGCNK